tara:strand:- start:1467 stop:1940 length:474 start_codon:yes stop_codon:yes gene_type:complete
MDRVIAWLAAGAQHHTFANGTDLTGFHFENWLGHPEDNTCGTTGCIAGAAVQFATEGAHSIKVGTSYNIVTAEQEFDNFGQYAADHLGLTDDEKKLLFYPFDLEDFQLADMGYPYFKALRPPACGQLEWTRDLNPEQIATVLQHFNTTGEIVWELVA